MRHNTAVEIDGGWRFASLSKRGGYALGDCAEHVHATEAGARECFSAYQRANVTLDGKCSWGSCTVKGCDAPANQFARIKGDGYAIAPLCPIHLTIENAIDQLHLSGPAGDSWTS